jgi:hypothetical protein
MKKQGTDVLFDLNVVMPIDLKLSVRFSNQSSCKNIQLIIII